MPAAWVNFCSTVARQSAPDHYGSGSLQATVKEVKEQEVYMGEIPLMTRSGSFVINGTERVIGLSCTVLQVCSSSTIAARPTLPQAAVFCACDSLPRLLAGLRIRSERLPLLRIDRRRKMPVTILLKALGYQPEQILAQFFVNDTFHLAKKACSSNWCRSVCV